MDNMDEKLDSVPKKVKSTSKKAVKKIEDTIDNIKSNENDTVKKTVKKATSRVASVAEKVEKGIKTKKEELDGKKKALDYEKKLMRSVMSKKNLYIEFNGKQLSEELIYERLIAHLKETGFEDTIKTLNIYYKIEDSTAYCVVNHGDPIVIKFND